MLDGRYDSYFGVNTAPPPGAPSPIGTPVSLTGVRRSLHDVTGLCSPDASKCLAAGPGGRWRVALPEHLTPGFGGADHAFMTSTASSARGTIDPRWRHGYLGEPTDPPVSLARNLDWLARRLGAPVLSSDAEGAAEQER